MTPHEQQLISTYAQTELFHVVNLMVYFVGYGAFVLGLVVAVHLLTGAGPWGRPKAALLVSLLAIFVSSTCQGTIAIGKIDLTSTVHILIQTADKGLAALVQFSTEEAEKWQDMSSWALTINLLLSDGIGVWRAWSLYHDSKNCRLILAILMIANVSINMADCIWIDVNSGKELSKSAVLDWLSAIISLVVDLVATILFACKAWNYHQYIAGLDTCFAHQGTWAGNILKLLIESGAIFCIIQSISVMITVLTTYNVITTPWVPNTIEGLAVIAAACYPVAVIILVSTIQTEDFHYISTEVFC
ncbi:hypothetical protein BDP27DRAFT_1425596 [Rhodocollybia butyracea]|uniref:Uncharacterized protein n=1 Tax=Rhodocollybia butyracea TaxID=206335 RepID=A0A9P5U386_9AGAR|nr:hypothetical protein BDP27DRAFT_1425596 [Rhodocollybia butyracea]